jgi:hypothetical protein
VKFNSRSRGRQDRLYVREEPVQVPRASHLQTPDQVDYTHSYPELSRLRHVREVSERLLHIAVAKLGTNVDGSTSDVMVSNRPCSGLLLRAVLDKHAHDFSWSFLRC